MLHLKRYFSCVALIIYACTTLWMVAVPCKAQEVAGFQVIGSDIRRAPCSVLIGILDAPGTTHATVTTLSENEHDKENGKGTTAPSTKNLGRDAGIVHHTSFDLKQNSFTVSLKLLKKLAAKEWDRKRSADRGQERGDVQSSSVSNQLSKPCASESHCEINASVALSCGKDSGFGVLPAMGVNIRLSSKGQESSVPIHTFRIIKLEVMQDKDFREKLSLIAAMLDESMRNLSSSDSAKKARTRLAESPLWGQVLEWKRQRSPWHKRRTRLIVRQVLLPSNHASQALFERDSRLAEGRITFMQSLMMEKLIRFKHWLKLRSKKVMHGKSHILHNMSAFNYYERPNWHDRSCMKTNANEEELLSKFESNYHQLPDRKERRQALVFAAILLAIVQLTAGRRIARLV